jgi:hypothetical protein
MDSLIREDTVWHFAHAGAGTKFLVGRTKGIFLRLAEVGDGIKGVPRSRRR